jgi:hypothetical protein
MPLSQDLCEILPLLWRLNDGLIIGDDLVQFKGPVQDVEEFKTLLLKLDPDLLYEFPEEKS